MGLLQILDCSLSAAGATKACFWVCELRWPPSSGRTICCRMDVIHVDSAGEKTTQWVRVAMRGPKLITKRCHWQQRIVVYVPDFLISPHLIYPQVWPLSFSHQGHWRIQESEVLRQLSSAHKIHYIYVAVLATERFPWAVPWRIISPRWL